MKKRILAFALCLCLLLPLFVGSVTANERIETVYDDDLKDLAVFNPMYLVGSSIAISNDPTTRENWSVGTQIKGENIPADLKVVIEDIYVSEQQSVYWYKISAAEGYTLPQDLIDNPWIMQGIIGDPPESCTLLIQQKVDVEADLPVGDAPVDEAPGAEEGILEEEIPEEGILEEEIPEETIPEEELPQWISYETFMTQQFENMIADPSIYVGCEAEFDVATWDTFVYAADPNVAIPDPEESFIYANELVDTEGNSIRLHITGYAVDAEGQIWYKVEAAEGDTLPDVLVENPYILNYVEAQGDFTSLVFVPVQGMFVGETVEVLKEPVMATPSVVLPTDELPDFFDVTPAGSGDMWYDLGDTTAWHETLAEKGYHYVSGESVILIPPEVTVAYQKLQKADSLEEYEQIWESLPESVQEQFTSKHKAELNKCYDELSNVQYTGTVEYNGIPLNVSVTGGIPKTGVSLSVEAVSNEDILNGGFDIASATEIITALDIKLLQEDGTEWQPSNGNRIAVSIDMASLGIEDESVVRLHHKHGEDIYVFEVFVVLDGKVTVGVNGLSTFAVTQAKGTTRADDITYNAGQAITMEVGQDKIFYCNINRPNNGVGTWQVYDPSGAIFYEVYSNDTPNHNAGMWVSWIRVVALKETNNQDANEENNLVITFRYNTVRYQNNNPANNGTGNEQTEIHRINITAPKSNDGVSLYLKDEVNTSGCITAVLVDQNGNVIENGLDGASFEWSRKNGETKAYINPRAYEDDYQSLNIVKDHAGLVEARRNGDTFDFVEYTLKVILADGTTEEATYTVYYQSEFINKGFEAPKITTSDYSFFPNGWAGLYWKTTAPGTGGNLIRDIEYGNNRNIDADFNIPAHSGTQFAELNAQEFGALYQDIITVPGEKIQWDFGHAARNSTNSNRMFVVLGATEAAQKLEGDNHVAHLKALGTKAKQAADALVTQERNAFYNGTGSVTIEYEGAMYTVWYHDAATAGRWTDLSGTYTVPARNEDGTGQYRTRLFFVTDPQGGTDQNYGNLIDTSAAGQYKEYLIEYYIQSYETVGNERHLKVDHQDGLDQKDKSLIYSTVQMTSYDDFINQNYYLYQVLINGKMYPYDISYNGTPSLYIDNYDGTATDLDLGDGETDYSKYDIVLQVVLRDTVIAVQKTLQFPTVDGTETGKQLLTEVQKLQIMEELTKDGGQGYNAQLVLHSLNAKETGFPEHPEDWDEKLDPGIDREKYEYVEYREEGDIYITTSDPSGKYTGFSAIGDDPKLNQVYVVEENGVTELPGLELHTVTFKVTRYRMGAGLSDNIEHVSYTIKEVEPGEPLISEPFEIYDEVKIADVEVINTYVEKEVTITYEAIGNGKVALTDDTDFKDIPTEQVKFYSEQARGAEVHEGYGATFVGWYKDKRCREEDKVTARDGVVDPHTGAFIPNANVIDGNITFYALFTTGKIIINREGAEEGQSFVYHVTNGKTGDEKIELYVSITCGEDGTGSTQILEVPPGTYTVTEVSDWSWRYEENSKREAVIQERDNDDDPDDLTLLLTATVDFGGEELESKWLSGLAEKVKNIFSGGAS